MGKKLEKTTSTLQTVATVGGAAVTIAKVLVEVLGKRK